MNRTDFIIVALRLLAIYLLVMGFTQLPSSIASLYATLNEQGAQFQYMAISTSLFGVTYFIACAVVWTMSPKIAKMVEGDLPQFESEDNELNMGNVLTVGLIILGFFVLSGSLPSLVNILFAVLLPSFDTNYEIIISSMGGNRTAIIPWSDFASLIIQIALGVWLILGSKGIVGYLKKVRYAGREAI